MLPNLTLWELIVEQQSYLKSLAVAPLLGVLMLTLSSVYAVVAPILGSITVTADNLKQYTSQVSTIGNALSEISTS